jgi:hypothetical protein
MGKSRSTGRRIAGGSASILGVGAGVSLAGETTDRDIAQALVTFLEDRRVLFNLEYLEIEDQANSSILQIRKELTESLQQLDPKGPAVAPLRAMRAACRKFLDTPRLVLRHFSRSSRHHDNMEPGFFVALGELRAVFSAELKRLDDLFKLDIEDHLRAEFPAADKP